MKSNFVHITRKEFENFLKNNFNLYQAPDWLYTKYWNLDIRTKEWYLKNRKKKIKEFLYLIKITEGLAIIVYSSIQKRTERTRDNSEDSIKLVAAEAYKLRPVRQRYPYLKRIETWRENFKKRVNDIIIDLKSNPPCEICGGEMVIRVAKTSGNKFYGCRRYPVCTNTRSIAAY